MQQQTRRRWWRGALVLACAATLGQARAQQAATVTPAHTPAGAAPAPGSPAAEMAAAVAAWDQRLQPGKIEQAIEHLERVVATEPGHYEALWRLAQCYWWHGDHAPAKGRLAIFEKGRGYAERAVQVNPRDPLGHYWKGVAIARQAEERGIINSLFALKDVVGSMNKCLELDPSFPWAHYVLAVIYLKAPGWPLSIGDKQKALDHAERAVKGGPEFLLPRVGLAQALIANDREDEARALLHEVLAAKPPPGLEPEAVNDKKAARALLAELDD